MFTPPFRRQLRSELLEHAAADARIAGVAITGSAAVDGEDEWSDIDLAFGVGDFAQLAAVLAEFTALMYERYGALQHYDVSAGAWIYRVFFLPETLQVDLAFVPQTEFRPLGSAFRLVSGEANPAKVIAPPAPREIIGLAWLYALHARSSIVRGKFLQAEYMIAGLRHQALALACIRTALPWAHGRGFDRLPPAFQAAASESMVRELNEAELWRALGAAIEALSTEVQHARLESGERIAAELAQIAVVPL